MDTDSAPEQQESQHAPAASTNPPSQDSTASAEPQPELTKGLSAEEQMALFEKELKESDWGHQPC